MLNNYKENLIYINKRVKMKVLRKMYKQKKGQKDGQTYRIICSNSVTRGVTQHEALITRVINDIY